MNKILVTKKATGELSVLEDISNYNVSCDSYICIMGISEVDISFNVESNVKLDVSTILEDVSLNLSFYLKDNSNVCVSSFIEDSIQNINIYLEGKHSVIYYNHSLLSKRMSSSHIMINHLAPHTESYLINHAISLDEDVCLTVDAIIPKGIYGCITHQDNNIITLGEGSVSILPNLKIDEYDVIADHSAYIGKFNKDELFYLGTRGLTMKDSYTLLAQAFLVGKLNFSLEENEILKVKIKEYMEVRKNES